MWNFERSLHEYTSFHPTASQNSWSVKGKHRLVEISPRKEQQENNEGKLLTVLALLSEPAVLTSGRTLARHVVTWLAAHTHAALSHTLLPVGARTATWGQNISRSRSNYIYHTSTEIVAIETTQPYFLIELCILKALHIVKKVNKNC